MKQLKSIRTKTLIFPLCFFLILLAVSFIFIHIYIEQSSFVNRFREQRLSFYSNITSIYTEFTTNHALIYDTLRVSMSESEEELYEISRSRLDSADNAFERLLELSNSSTNEVFLPVEKLDSLIKNMKHYNKITASALMQASVNVEFSYSIMSGATKNYREINNQFSELLMLLNQNLMEDINAVDSHMKGDFVFFIGIGLASIFGVLLFSLFYTSHLTSPIFHLITSVKKITSGNKSVRCQVETNDEIGELAKEVNNLAESLEYAEAVGEEKNSFLANMSHEIRTPLNGIVATSELLLETTSPSERSSYTQLIYKSSKSLLSVIDDILDYSRVETGKIEVESRIFSLKKLLEEVKSLFDLSTEKKNVQLLLTYTNVVTDSYIGDERRIRQIVLHLVGNAIKFTFQGLITIDVDVALVNYKSWVSISVRDTGIGIKEKDINNIFKGFYQVDHTTTRAYGGSGLGLAISHKLALLMNGQLLVSSSLGKGSTFTLKLPLEPAFTPTEVVNKKRITDYNKHALVVDDTPSNQIIAKAVLAKLGFSVVIAENGKVAITKLLNQDFDIVFMDMHMPVLDGIEATKQIRQLTGGKEKVPIIALTANVLPEDKALCLEAGMNGVVTKPITKDKIVAEIDTVFAYFSESAEDSFLKSGLATEN